MPNTLIFVDLASPDPHAAAQFYRDVMGWDVEGRPSGIFHRIVPGGDFALPDGSPSGVGHLHLGIYSTSEPRPDPNPPRRKTIGDGPSPRVYILVESREGQDVILTRAEQRGAEILWRDQYWREFEGWHGSFRDPWGNQIVLWTKPAEGDDAPHDAPY
jgi:predicted enzyme related to lactoylglutathione lyase